MNMKTGISILIAATAGFAAGIAARKMQQYTDHLLSPEKVMGYVKNKVKKELPVNGAWIGLTPLTQTKDALTSNVYQGGLTVKDGHAVKHYDFIADACTGSLLKLKLQE
ncbi:hypothetical protein ABNN70_14145 [Sporolactobacillus sp. Y61]|uniref:PepSY domain-containing protein n=1 Tax=Sporolactobacillus sp. Y61 TaxID=3160863 RepID=A0AAU8IFK3_9BACL